MFKDDFIAAIHNKTKILLTFLSKEDGAIIVRTCAPMDFGESRRLSDKIDRFHLWDFDSDTKEHVLSIKPEQIKALVILRDKFEPSEFITWSTTKSPWFIKRDWGIYS
jgi:hypothetical protein